MEAAMTMHHALLNRLLSRLMPLLVLVFASSGLMAQTDPPARVASLSHIEGSVALARAGETEWTDAVLNRPITRGDRVWTDPGSRAEVHLGSAVLHMDGQSFVDITALDDQALQASLNEGSVNARVRELAAGENFEIDTPQLAFRASQPGDYRVDVDPARGTTRVTVHNGIALVYGANGQAQQLQAGQQIAFAGRDLERVAVQASPAQDGFDRWAADRNRLEDQSIAARYIPREVVGYQQLDPYGTWAQDPTYGAIWYPRVTLADWAPYRYGHWEWIGPWGWTWIDDAPWGFSPFHYGRWAIVGSRWAWVPGRIGRRPVYAPALVGFVGGTGNSGWNLSIGSSRGIAWYPLAPGEAWRPAYRTSPVYVRNVNRNIVGTNAANPNVHRGRCEALTAVRVEDFARGRPVHSHWSRVNPVEISRAPLATGSSLPEPPRMADRGRTARGPVPPAAQAAAPVVVGRPRAQAVPGTDLRELRDRSRPIFGPREQAAVERPRRMDGPPSAIETPRAGQERAQREQQLQWQRQQDEQRRRLQAQIHRDQALRQQQAAQGRLQGQQEMQQQRIQRQHELQQQRAAQVQRERVLRQQQAAQERSQRQQEIQQQRLQRQQEIQQQQRAAQIQQQQARVAGGPPAHAGPQRGQPAAERGRRGPEARGEARLQRDEDGRGRGQGHGRGG
jgi:hypothetical protein